MIDASHCKAIPTLPVDAVVAWLTEIVRPSHTDASELLS
jgi:hypothetical protein